MQNDRRRFLKLTGITSAGFLAGFDAMAGPFGFLPPDQQDFVYIQGLFPAPDSIQESGFHLRWILPPAKGLPDTIIIYRRGGDKARPYGFINDPSACQSGGWKQAAVISNKGVIALQDRIPAQARNFYLRSETDRNRYRELAPQYAAMLAALRNPDPRLFQLAGNNAPARIPFSELKFRNKRNDMPEMSLSANDILMLGSLDPNIARMLGLYWVDPELRPGEMTDYKVEAEYANPYFQGKICGVFQGATTRVAAKPQFAGNPIAQQADQAFWEFNDQLQPQHKVRLRISWPAAAPVADPVSAGSSIVAYVLAVANEPLKLILPQQENSGNRLEYFCNRVPFSSTAIPVRLAGVDLFGQLSEFRPATCTPRELMPPPPPGKLQFRDQTGGKILLDFEYGAAQYLSDPDPAGFTLYQKKERLYDGIIRVPYQQVVAEGQDATGKTIYTILINSTQPPARTVQFIEGPNGKKLTVSQRYHFTVVYQQQGKIGFVSDRPLNLPPTGKIQLEPDLRNTSQGWNALRVQIPANRSFDNLLKLLRVSFGSSTGTAGLTVKITGTETGIRDRDTAPFQENVPGNFPDRYTSVRIDQELFRGDLFTGGRLLTARGSFPVLAQQAGNLLIVEGHQSFNTGEPCQLFAPPQSTSLAVLTIENTPLLEGKKGGEFLFRCAITEKVTVNKNGRTEEQVRNRQPFVIARLLSMPRRTDTQQWQCLVSIAGSFPGFSIQVSGTALRYFEPYVVDLTAASAFPGQPGEALRQSYYAVETRDTAGNKSALSAIAQLILSNNSNLTTPAPPYPCGNAAASETWLPLPDAKGNAAVCVQWNNSGTGLRYELARASDQAILMAHRSLWYKGMPHTSDDTGKEIIGTVRISGTGPLLTLTCTWPAGSDPTRFAGGRILQSGLASAPARRAFEIIRAEKQGSTASFIIRSHTEGVTPATNGAALFHILPDYAALLANDSKVRALADLITSNPDFPVPEGLNAFSLVTPQPLRNSLQFLDLAPGQGTNRYYYKVRSVDAAENRSRWSNASIPFRQMDTRVPAAPEAQTTKACCLNGKLMLYWKQEAGIGAWILRRKTAGCTAQPVEYTLLTAQLKAKPLICQQPQTLTLEQPILIPAADAAAASRLINTSFFVELLKPGGDERIAPRDYEVVYQFDAIGKQLMIRGVHFLQKRDGSRRYRIGCGTVRITEESSFLHFLDEQGLSEGSTYEYELIAVRTTGPSGAFRIRSEATALPPLKMVSQLAPPPPGVEKTLLDLSGQPWNGDRQVPRNIGLRISPLIPGTRVRILKFSTAVPETLLASELILLSATPPVLVTDGTIQVTAGMNALLLRDTEPLLTEARRYIIQVENSTAVVSDDIIINDQP